MDGFSVIRSSQTSHDAVAKLIFAHGLLPVTHRLFNCATPRESLILVADSRLPPACYQLMNNFIQLTLWFLGRNLSKANAFFVVMIHSLAIRLSI
jgi:hypothetical protein